MEYKINPETYGDVFVLPKAVVNENLRLAGAVGLKALLYLYCNSSSGNTSCEAIAKALGADRGDVADAMVFWLERGLVLKDGEQPHPAKTAEAEEEPKKEEAPAFKAEEKAPAKKVAELPISRPSHEQIAIRCGECEELRLLFSEAQNILGKTIGYEGQSILIMLYDSYGLPAEVILMLLEYALSKGKTGYKYIASVGKEWSEKEIDTIEKAGEYINAQNEADALWRQFCEQTGVKNPKPTAKQRKFLNSWSKEFSFSCEMICLAYEICVDNTGKMNLEYMNKVLKSWHDKGVKSPSDAQREQERWNESRFGKAQKKTEKKKQEVFSSNASYDIGKYEKDLVALKYLDNEE